MVEQCYGGKKLQKRWVDKTTTHGSHWEGKIWVGKEATAQQTERINSTRTQRQEPPWSIWFNLAQSCQESDPPEGTSILFSAFGKQLLKNLGQNSVIHNIWHAFFRHQLTLRRRAQQQQEQKLGEPRETLVWGKGWRELAVGSTSQMLSCHMTNRKW